jgi:hypothetical protein
MGGNKENYETPSDDLHCRKLRPEKSNARIVMRNCIAKVLSGVIDTGFHISIYGHILAYLKGKLRVPLKLCCREQLLFWYVKLFHLFHRVYTLGTTAHHKERPA